MKSIFHIYATAFKALINNQKYLFKSVIIPFCIIVFLELLSSENDNYLKGFISGLIDLLAYCYMVINTHRIIIIGSGSVSNFGIYKPTSREISFLAHFIGMSLLFTPFILTFLIPQLSMEIILPCLIVMIIYVSSRLSLVFPAIAIDAGWSYSDSWLATKDYKLLIFCTIGLIPVFITGILMGLNYFLDVEIISAILSTAATMIFVAIVSATYQFIEKREIPSQPSTPTDTGKAPF
ncbi:MAG: hypothetical protein V2B20_21860 [Pseudomonadota bacterium]